MASIPLCKNLIFIKCLGFSAGTSLFTGLNSLLCEMFRIMDVTLYPADEKSVFVDSTAISCREESCGSDIENKRVLILWTPLGWSIMSIRVIRASILDSG